MRTKILLLLMMISFHYSKAYIAENKEDVFIKVVYKQRVNGFKVSAIWVPERERYGYLVGKAVMKFEGKNTFEIKNYFFALPEELVDYTLNDDYEVTSFKTRKLYLDYEEELEEGKFYLSEPFAFMDLDFDKKKELVIKNYEIGQRGVSVYEVYSLLGEHLRIYPFDEIDDLVTFDAKKKQVISYGDGGVCTWSKRIYTKKKDRFVLTKIVRNDFDNDENKCYESIYIIENGEEKLISRKEAM